MRPSELKIGDEIITLTKNLWNAAIPIGSIGKVTYNPCRSGEPGYFDAQFSCPDASPTSDCVMFSGAKVRRVR